MEEKESHVKGATFRSRILSFPGISRLVKRGGKPVGEQERKTKKSQPAGKKQGGSHPQGGPAGWSGRCSHRTTHRIVGRSRRRPGRGGGRRNEEPGVATEKQELEGPGRQVDETTVPDTVVPGQLKEQKMAVEEDRDGEPVVEKEQAVGDPAMDEERDEVKGLGGATAQTRLPGNIVPPPQE